MGHHHHHIDPAAGDRRIAVAVLINMALTAARFVGGLLSGSLALIADALHNFSDAISLIIAFGARKIARRPAGTIKKAVKDALNSQFQIDHSTLMLECAAHACKDSPMFGHA